MDSTPAFDVPIYLTRVAIHNDLLPAADRRTFRTHYTRFGPIPFQLKKWNEDTVRGLPEQDPPRVGCRSVQQACPEPVLIVHVPAGSGAELVHTESSGGVAQTWLRWPGAKRPKDWDAYEVLHAAWHGHRGLSAEFAPGSTWTAEEIRAWPRHERGGPNAPPAEEPPPPPVVTAPAPAPPPAAEAPPNPVPRRVVAEAPPIPTGPAPKRAQLSLFGEEAA